ncbi:hypothetical protein AC578_2 [Pseudocercospora eumusae]|uniref:F-box domain-containing protein n=1 Tax=Pseudocercospora eumusae TaxID=321146 RepID=A0A139GUV2_9PEZI|nr:hypothetical protein AC578_2 [Pseudocercospora eumusae]
MARWPPASFADLPVEMLSWVSDRIKHKEDLLSFCRVCWSSRNIGLRTLRHRLRSIYIEPTAASIAKFKTIVANPAVSSGIQTIIYLQTVPLFEPLSLLQRADFDAEVIRHRYSVSDGVQVVVRFQDRLSGSPMQALEQCLVEAVEQLPKLQHIVIAASPAAVESDTSRHYSGDILNADSKWIVNESEYCGDSAAKDKSRFFWGLAPLLVAMAHHADCQPEVPLNFTFQGRLPLGTDELRDFAEQNPATFNKAMGHIKNFYVRATLIHGVIHDGPAVVNSETYEEMLSNMDNLQGLVILTNLCRHEPQQADVLSVLLSHPTLHFRRLQGVQFLTSMAIFDPALEWEQQEWIPLLHTAQELFAFLWRHRKTLKCLALDCVSGVHEINPQGLEIETLHDLVLALRTPTKFGRLESLSIVEAVILGQRHDDIGLPRAQVLNRLEGREASSRLGKLARELHAVCGRHVWFTLSDGTLAHHEYNGSPAGTATATHVDHGASAAAQPGQKDNADTEVVQAADPEPAETNSTSVETVNPQDVHNDNGRGNNAKDATPAVVPVAAAAIESKPDTPEKEQLSQQDNTDTADAQAAALERAGADATAGEEVSTRDSSNDNGTGEDASLAVIYQHLVVGYEFQLKAVKPDGN